jgi:ElaB/YqjD/DUF883 family membrane-anchored ribosome-binding protein
LLKVVLKNLADPVKAQDPKYRQLKLDNEKIRAKLVVYPQAMNYLRALGFVETKDEETGSPIIRIEMVDSNVMETSFQEVVQALDLISPPVVESTNKKAKLDDPLNKLTGKQKSRILMEEKERLERQKAKEVRKQNVAMIKQDKYVRENDPNWQSGVSAAAAKNGSGISTFRDKYGENDE